MDTDTKPLLTLTNDCIIVHICLCICALKFCSQLFLLLLSLLLLSTLLAILKEKNPCIIVSRYCPMNYSVKHKTKAGVSLLYSSIYTSALAIIATVLMQTNSKELVAHQFFS